MQFFYEFAAPAGAFAVRSAIDLATPIGLYAGAWPWRQRAAAAPDIEIMAAEGDGCRLQIVGRPELRQSVVSPLDAASALIDMLTRLALERLGGFADLHAGSALIDGALVVMPGASLAGKSTLALQLAARGHLLGGDDRLLIGPLDGGAGIGGLTLGLNARVRLPVHPGAGAAFAAFVAARLITGPGLPPGIGFVAPLADEAASFGRRAPIAAIVLPQRRDTGGIGLEPATPAEIMRQLLEQMHAPHLPAAPVVAAAQALATGRPGFVLRFDDSALGAAAIEALARRGFRE